MFYLFNDYVIGFPQLTWNKGPHADTTNWRIGAIHLLARWHKRTLNEALVSLCLVLLE